MFNIHMHKNKITKRNIRHLSSKFSYNRLIIQYLVFIDKALQDYMILLYLKYSSNFPGNYVKHVFYYLNVTCIYHKCWQQVRKLPLASFLLNSGHSDTRLPCLFPDSWTLFHGVSIQLCFLDICLLCMVFLVYNPIYLP